MQSVPKVRGLWQDEKRIAQWLADELAGNQKSHYLMEPEGEYLRLSVEIDEKEPSIWDRPVSKVVFLMEAIHDCPDWNVSVIAAIAENETKLLESITGHLSLLTGGGIPCLNGSNLPIHTVDGVERVMAIIWRTLTGVIPYSGILLSRRKNEIRVSVNPQHEAKLEFHPDLRPRFPRWVDIREMNIKIAPYPNHTWIVVLDRILCMNTEVSETHLETMVRNLEYKLEDGSVFRFGVPFDPKKLWPEVNVMQHLHITN